MPNAAEDRIAASLTMCRKAGKLLLGFDAAADAVKAGQAQCILLAEDISPKTEKEVRYIAEKFGSVPIAQLPYTMDALTAYFRKRTGVFCVCEKGFAEKLLKLLRESDNT